MITFSDDILAKLRGFVSPHSFASRETITNLPIFMEQLGYEYLGYGAYRMAFYCPINDVVIKLPMSKRGYEHNRLEWDFCQNENIPESIKSMFALCIHHNEDFSVYQRAEVKWKYTKRDMKKMVKIRQELLQYIPKRELDDIDIEYTRSCLGNFGRIKKGLFKKQIIVIDYPYEGMS